MSSAFVAIQTINCHLGCSIADKSRYVIGAGETVSGVKVSDEWIRAWFIISNIDSLQLTKNSTPLYISQTIKNNQYQFVDNDDEKPSPDLSPPLPIMYKDFYIPITDGKQLLMVQLGSAVDLSSDSDEDIPTAIAESNSDGSKNMERGECSCCMKQFRKITLDKYEGTCYTCFKKKRPTISKKLRREVWDKRNKKTNGKCFSCKGQIDIDDFECGHIESYLHGGPTILTNLEPICRSCNRSCSSKNLHEFMKTLK